MTQLSTPLMKILRGVIASLFGLSLGCIFWMLTLPSGFISKKGVVLAAGVATLSAFLFYRFLIPYFNKRRNEFKFRLWIIIVVLALLTGIVYQKVIVRQSLIFPFVPKQTLTLTLQSDSILFRPIECELTTLYSKDFIVNGDLQRIDSTLMILSGNGSTLTWTGWPGSTCVFTADIKSLNAFQLAWVEGGTIPTGRLSDNQEEVSWNITFPISYITKIIVAAILTFASLAVVLVLVCSYMMFLRIKSGNQTLSSQNKPNKWFSNILAGMFIVLSLVLLLRLIYEINPYTHFPSRDDGVFLYIGQGLLSGQTPYLDAWDHKGPLIYFINALGKLLDPAGEWGIFALIATFTLATLYTLYKLMKERVGTTPILIGLVVFLGLLLEMGALGNLVETYALLFFAAGLIAAVRAIETGKTRFMLLFGIMGGLAFCLRANLISIFIVAASAWLISALRKKASLIKGIGSTLAGVLIVLIPFGAFFGSRHALGDLFDQALRFNFLYAGSTEVDFWTKLTDFAPASLPTAIFGLISILFTTGVYREKSKPNQNLLLFILTFAFFLELVLSRLSGYDFAHYSLPLLLIVTLILVLFFESLNISIQGLFSEKGGRFIIAAVVIFLLGLITILTIGLVNQDYSRPKEEVLQPEILSKLSTRPTLLVWGAEVQVNYLTGRPSPTRYLYQYPLVNDAYCTPAMEDELLVDIKTNLPVILDASNGNPWMPSLDPGIRSNTTNSTQLFGSLYCLNDFFTFIQENYSPVYTMPGHRWTIYLPTNTGNSQ